jgi:hypothetical protein
MSTTLSGSHVSLLLGEVNQDQQCREPYHGLQQNRWLRCLVNAPSKLPQVTPRCVILLPHLRDAGIVAVYSTMALQS